MTVSTPTPNDVRVEQVDVDAAKAFWMRHIAGWQEVTAGQRALVQAFARHRLSSTRPPDELDRLRHAIKCAIQRADDACRIADDPRASGDMLAMAASAATVAQPLRAALSTSNSSVTAQEESAAR